MVDHADIVRVLRALKHLPLVLLSLLVRQQCFLHMHLLFTLDLAHLLLELLFLFLKALLLGEGGSASIARVLLILNFFLLFLQFSLQAHLLVFLSLSHGHASSCHFLRFQLFELLNLPLLLEVLPVAGLFGFFLRLLLLFNRVRLHALLA